MHKFKGRVMGLIVIHTTYILSNIMVGTLNNILIDNILIHYFY